MWIMSKHGFYSIVDKGAGEIHVRARERGDLENLLKRVPLEGVDIVETPKADYAARIITDRSVLLHILAFLGESLDYDNFKGCIGHTPDQKRKPYHAVWDVMAEALGAYGVTPE